MNESTSSKRTSKNLDLDNYFKIFGNDMMIITLAPKVCLTRRLVHSADVVKTKRSGMLLMLKSSQIKVFCILEEIQEIQNRRYFSNSRPPAGQHEHKGKSQLIKIRAARTATSTTSENHFFILFLVFCFALLIVSDKE